MHKSTNIFTKAAETLMILMLIGVSARAQQPGQSGQSVQTSPTTQTADALKADENIIEVADTTIVNASLAAVSDALLPVDSVVIIDGEQVRLIQSVPIGGLGHSPHTATMYAAVLPGLGQIYNRKYWKLPLLYGGAAALGYSIHFNNKYYKKYSSAYRDFLIQDPNNKAYMEFVLKAHMTEEMVMTTNRDWFKSALERKKNYYRRYRDLSIFGMIGLYAIQIVDACVDAHFFNFDISDDLSARWAPIVSPDNGGQVGAAVAFNF